MSPYYNDKKQLVIEFGRYSVVQKKKNFNAIYFDDTFLCHRSTWNTATKMAKMLKEAYDEGYYAGSWQFKLKGWVKFLDTEQINKFNKICYSCKNGRYMTSTGWIICHGFSSPIKASEILSIKETSCDSYEKEED